MHTDKQDGSLVERRMLTLTVGKLVSARCAEQPQAWRDLTLTVGLISIHRRQEDAKNVIST
jgi:hypothetical protein